MNVQKHIIVFKIIRKTIIRFIMTNIENTQLIRKIIQKKTCDNKFISKL